MEITVYNSLSRMCADPVIRWPGADALKHWAGRDKFAALSVIFKEEKTKDAIRGYSTALISRGARKLADILPLEFESDGPGYSRFCVSRLLLREWARLLHNDRLSIVLSDEPRPASRVRSYKGLVSPDCRTRAFSFDQLEVEVDTRSSVLINRIEIDSAVPASCLAVLGDTFRSFGVYNWPESPSAEVLLRQITSCYESQQSLWQWESCRLLPTVCAHSTPIFFLQGVANETVLQMVVYLPLEQVHRHLDAATATFGAGFVGVR